ncbi:uncharacterized protein LOC134854521 [Symsagittifera roscoffensis]|uniref:uncharacterized protein LOC134854521 n=1 Tax=Symsagittifera roscoffensis TaxID=84072 RepID=UPI00307B29DE
MAASAPSYAHMLPGYGVIVSRFDRPTGQAQSVNFDAIRESARNEWLSHYESFNLPEAPPLTETSYTAQYAPKKRFSPHKFSWDEERTNKPHPSEVFLCTHLKTLPGFYKRNTASVKNTPGFKDAHVAKASSARPYKVDGSTELMFAEQLKRMQQKEKPVAVGGDDKTLNSFMKNEPIYRSLDPQTAQATEAWLKMAKPEDGEAVQEMLEYVVKKDQAGKMVQNIAKPEVQSKIQNWLKSADREKVDAAHKLFAALESGKLIDRKSSTAFRYSPTVYKYERLNFKPKPREYKLHPSLIDRDYPPPIRTGSK